VRNSSGFVRLSGVAATVNIDIARRGCAHNRSSVLSSSRSETSPRCGHSARTQTRGATDGWETKISIIWEMNWMVHIARTTTHHGYRTHIDRLAREGAVHGLVRQQSCTAGRAAFITAIADPHRLTKVDSWSRSGCSGRPTIAELRTLGYVTGQFVRTTSATRDEFFPLLMLRRILPQPLSPSMLSRNLRVPTIEGSGVQEEVRTTRRAASWRTPMHAKIADTDPHTKRMERCEEFLARACLYRTGNRRQAFFCCDPLACTYSRT